MEEVAEKNIRLTCLMVQIKSKLQTKVAMQQKRSGNQHMKAFAQFTLSHWRTSHTT